MEFSLKVVIFIFRIFRTLKITSLKFESMESTNLDETLEDTVMVYTLWKRLNMLYEAEEPELFTSETCCGGYGYKLA